MNFVNYLATILTYHFSLFWLMGMLAILVVSIGLHRAGWIHAWQQGTARPVARTEPLPVAALVAFGIFLLAYFAFMFWSEDFTYEDDHNFTSYSAIGVWRPAAIWVDVGRFWPLGYQEYNLISYLSKSATAYLVFGAVQLLLLLWVLYREAMPSISPAKRLAVLALLLMCPAFAMCFNEITYADRNVCFAIGVLIFCVVRYDRRPSLAWLIPALVAGYCALYYKELTPALIGTFALSRLMLKLSRSGWREALRSPLEIGLLVGVACYAFELALVLLPTGTSDYINKGFVGRPTALLRYLSIDLLVTAFVIAFAVHVVQVFKRGGKFDPFWDALGAAGVMHLVAASSTGLVGDYLLGPTELIAMLTLVRLVPAWWSERRGLRPVMVAILGVVAVVSVAFGTYRLAYRKAVVVETTRVTDFLLSHYQKPGTDMPRLYFRGNYGLVVNYASYLRYRGLTIRRVDDPPGTKALDLAGSEPYEGNVCHYIDGFVCRSDSMRVGDLVVRLPEEGTLLWPTYTAKAEPPAGAHLQPLYRATPANAIPSLRPVLAFLHWASPTFHGVFPREALTDDWASASIAEVVASQ